MAKRSRNDIVENILRNTGNWKSKTCVYHKSNTSYVNFLKYYNSLIGSELLEERKPAQDRYECKRTKKGEEALTSLKKTSLLLNDFKKIFYKS
ncbi:MAG: hypothetical protein JW700_02455 [Candidatus Aenigmarchaeota archaeon]|nr:hypothetical protein [Candidatus Aenigmarchaeota archaeon]